MNFVCRHADPLAATADSNSEFRFTCGHNAAKLCSELWVVNPFFAEATYVVNLVTQVE